jgi:hypothetical protein
MKIRIPKSMRGVANPKVLTINLNDFDIDLFLPSLFFTVLGGGAPIGKRVNDPTALSSYISKLATHPDLEGFDDRIGTRVLRRIVRTDLVLLGRKGRSRAQEQILALAPHSLLVSKSGFPKEGTRQRGVDTFLYQALLSAQVGSRFEAELTLRKHFKRLFGHGVEMAALPLINGQYDGVTPLDTLTRLSLAFLDGLEPSSVGKQGGRRQPQPSCPELAAMLGRDILSYLFGYSELMPSAALAYNLQALINLELFVYTLKVVHAVNELVTDPEHLPAAMKENGHVSSPELYLDFTGLRSGISQAMATSCVRRDVEAYQRFLTSNILLRQLSGYVEQLRRVPARAKRIEEILDGVTDGPRYLQGLLLLMQDAEINLWLENKADDDETLIRQEYSNDGEDDAELEALEAVAAGANSSVERVILMLCEGQSKRSLENSIRWYWSVGGLKKPHGILTGALNVRQSWRYAPSNDLLAVLVQLAAIQANDQVEPNVAKRGEATHPRPIQLGDFLQYLERRFGILIDRPPAQFTGADAAAAARENLRAMLGRLRQMGIFSDLSDDFTVQRLQPPYADERRASQRS